MPFFTRFMDTGAIIAAWESGASLGLTDYQRVRYLEKLKAKYKGNGTDE